MPSAKRIATTWMVGSPAGIAFTTASMVVKTMIAAVATRNGTVGRA